MPPRPTWRKYIEFTTLLLIGQSIALISATSMLQHYITAVFGNHILWADALVLLPVLPGFLVLGVVTVTIMKHYPGSVAKAAIVMRLYLLVVVIIAWWLIDSPVLGWSTWAVSFGAFAATYVKPGKQ